MLRQEDYRSLRAELGEREGWPPDGSVRRWLGGSWNDALRAARLMTVPDREAIVSELGPAFTREECVLAVRDYMADTGARVPGLHAVLSWARRRDVRARPGRRPRSQRPFDRLFSSWHEVLEQAGVVVANGASAYEHVRPPHGSGYTLEQLRDAMRLVAGRLGRSPKQREYIRERERIVQKTIAGGGLPAAMPSHAVFHERYGTWDAALIDAGLEPTDGRQTRRVMTAWSASGRPYSTEELIRWIRDAHTELGDPLTSTAYIGWRSGRLEANERAGVVQRIPDYGAMHRTSAAGRTRACEQGCA